MLREDDYVHISLENVTVHIGCLCFDGNAYYTRLNLENTGKQTIGNLRQLCFSNGRISRTSQFNLFKIFYAAKK